MLSYQNLKKIVTSKKKKHSQNKICGNFTWNIATRQFKTAFLKTLFEYKASRPLVIYESDFFFFFLFWKIGRKNMHRVQKNILTTGSHDDSQHFTRVNFPAHILKNLPTIDLHTKITKTKKNWYILFHVPTHSPGVL